MKKTINIGIICILILIFTAMGIAYAKYVANIHGRVEAKIACWSFKVNSQSNENFTINLAETRTEVEKQTNVEEGFVGPGTFGAFEIRVDGNDSDVSLEYDINMDVGVHNNEKFPKNLIFYSDAEMKTAIYHGNGCVNLKGFISVNDENKIQSKMIYWKWDYETGHTDDEKNKNDLADSLWMGKNVYLNINVAGIQVTNGWSNNQCEVIFDANGGTIQEYGNSSQTMKRVNYAENYGDLPMPVREGYRFIGWGKDNYNFNNIEYIETNNSGYIDTEYKANSKTSFEIVAQVNNMQQADGCLLGSRDSVTNCFVLWHNNLMKIDKDDIQMLVRTTYEDAPILYFTGFEFRKIQYKNKKIYVDNECIDQEFVEMVDNNQLNLYLLGLNQGGRVDSRKYRGKVKYCKIWDDDILVRDFVPCLKESNNLYGMYDKVNNVFYKLDGTKEECIITNLTMVEKNQNHTLTAIWEKED